MNKDINLKFRPSLELNSEVLMNYQESSAFEKITKEISCLFSRLNETIAFQFNKLREEADYKNKIIGNSKGNSFS